MKARVKATREIVEVRGIYTPTIRTFGMEEIESYDMKDVEIITDPDYWTRLEHTYAGMAMQGMIRRAYEAYCDDCANYENMIFEDAQALLKDHAEALADVCVEFAHALVEKMKEKEE